ncbi:MAG: hypothetical protein K9J48_01700 [Desulfohalobiaceae bacterium]|nr:hypothetical protein [Desulfohalobiaceae bacterium]
MLCSPRGIAVFIAGMALLLSACGYHFSSAAPLDLPRNMERLYLGEIEDPTTEPQLESRLRTSIRNEFTQRGDVQWVPRERAEGQLQVRIMSFSSSSKLENPEQETVRFEAVLRFQGRIFQSEDDALVWESRELTVRESYAQQSERDEAKSRVVRLAAEKLANQLVQGF